MRQMPIGAAFAAALLTTHAVAQSMDPKPASDATPMMAIDTPTFLKVASGSNEFEIQSSKLAKQQAKGATLSGLADMIIADHTKAGERLKATLEADGRPFEPAPPAPKQEKMLAQLRAAIGKDFDLLYLDVQAQAHMEAVALFRTYAGSGDNQTLVGFAKQTLPRLETHLGHVKALLDAQ